MHDERTLRLAILNACEGARTSRSDPFAGAAQSLVQQGVPAVIAMQFEITDEAAIALAHEFYAALADSYPVDAALAEARKAIFARGNDVEWGTPVLYLRSPDGHIFDVEQVSQAERTQAQVDSLLRQSQEAEVKQDWESVAKSLRGVLDLDPAHSQAAVDLHRAQDQLKLAALYAQGCQLYQEEQWNESLRAFRQVQQVDGKYRDVEQWIAAVEQRLSVPPVEPLERRVEGPTTGAAAPAGTATGMPEEPVPKPEPREKRNWLRIAVPIALIAFLVLCGGGYAAVKWVQSRLSTPTPAVIKTTPRVTPPTSAITPVAIATRTPRVTRHAVLATPVPLSRSVNLVVILEGEPFKHPAIVEAVGIGVPWSKLAATFYSDQAVEFTMQVQGEQFGLDTEQYSPQDGRDLLKQGAKDLSYDVVRLYVLVTEGDESLQAFGENMTDALSDLNFEIAGLKLVDREIGSEVTAEIVKAKEGVLWLERQ